MKVYRDRFEPKLNKVDIMRNRLFDTDILLDVLSNFIFVLDLLQFKLPWIEKNIIDKSYCMWYNLFNIKIY